MRSAGVDPRQERQRQIDEVSAKAEAERIEEERKVTVQALFDRWAQTDLQPRLRTDGRREGRKDGGQYTKELFNRRIFPKLGHRPVAEVTRGEWLAVLDQVTAEGKLRTANVLLTDLSLPLGVSQRRGHRTGVRQVVRQTVGRPATTA